MKVLSRLVWYVAKRLVLAFLVLGLLTIAFYFSMHAANIYVIVKDGMAKRAQVVMMQEDVKALMPYFSERLISEDDAVKTIRDKTNPYQYYAIKGIYHRLQMKWMWCWPWEDTARAVVEEKIPGIDGRIKPEYKNAVKEENQFPPRWRHGQYELILSRAEGRWKIESIRLTKVMDDDNQ